MVYDERVRLISEKIQQYIFVGQEFKYTAITSKGQNKLTYCHQITLAGELVQCIVLNALSFSIADIRDEIHQIHANRTDNEVRYLKSLVSKDYPDGDVALQRRNRKTKLVDVVVMGKTQEEKEEETSGPTKPQVKSPGKPKVKKQKVIF